jgi:hypothetical protein
MCHLGEQPVVVAEVLSQLSLGRSADFRDRKVAGGAKFLKLPGPEQEPKRQLVQPWNVKRVGGLRDAFPSEHAETE